MVQRVFEALTSPVRRQILVNLAPGPRTAGEIARAFDISKPAISQHLTILEAAGLVSSARKGQFVHYTLTADDAREALSALITDLTPPPPLPNPEVPRREGGAGVGYRWEAWRTKPPQ